MRKSYGGCPSLEYLESTVPGGLTLRKFNNFPTGIFTSVGEQRDYFERHEELGGKVEES